MAYKFLQTEGGKILLVRDNIIVSSNVERIAGFEQLRITILDTAVDSLAEQLKANGVLLQDSPALEPELIKRNVVMGNEKDDKSVSGVSAALITATNTISGVINLTVALALGFFWFGGMVLATGWMKLVAVFPFYAWYLCVALAFERLGWVVTAVN